jgi:ABC-type antimicrobial peptide transport system permease subunit
LGVQPVIGRTFQPGEDKPGGEKVAVLTYGMWQSKFGGDRQILGQSLTINGENYTVVGVLPPTFQFALRNNDLWLPYQPSKGQLTYRFMHGTNLIGRLNPGVTIEQANSELSAIAKRIADENGESHAGTSVRLVLLQEQIVGDVKPILYVLLAAVGFRSADRLCKCRESAANALIVSPQRGCNSFCAGASRWRVARQLLTESILLSLVGGVVGLAVAYWGLQALIGVLPQQQLSNLPFLQSLHIDTRILAFSVLLSTVTGILFGSVPALQSSRLD